MRQPTAEVNFHLHARSGQADLCAACDPPYSHVEHRAMTPPWVRRSPASVPGVAESAAGRTGQLGLELGDALFQLFEARARALGPPAVRVQFLAAGQVELAEVCAQHRAEIVLEVLAQSCGTGDEPRRQALHQAAQYFLDLGY